MSLSAAGSGTRRSRRGMAGLRWLAPAIGLLAMGCGHPSQPPPQGETPPNVVLLVGQGFGQGAWAIGRALATTRQQRLVLDGAEQVGFLDPHSADRLVTDPAAAAIAWSTGRLAKSGAAPMDAKNVGVNLFERLGDAKRARGLITTGRVTDAAVAPFYARVVDPGDEATIAAQLVAAPPTVVIGGGRREFLPVAAGGDRRDDRDLLRESVSRGVAVFDSLAAPLPPGRKSLLLLARAELPHEIDRSTGPDLESLVVATIRRLAADGPGWFLVVDEARIEQAAAAHDGPALARDVLRLDRAVRAALRQVDLKRTLVVAVADRATANPNLDESARPESLDVVSRSVEEMGKRIFDGKPWKGTPRGLQDKALPILVDGAHHAGLTNRDVDRLLTARTQEERDAALGTAISRRFGIVFMAGDEGFASKVPHGHTAEPVLVRAWGVRAAEVHDIHDHAELGRWLADVLRLPAER